MGNLPPCPLGRVKIMRFQQFLDWLTQSDAKMEFFNSTESKRKTAYLSSNAGPENGVLGKKAHQSRPGTG